MSSKISHRQRAELPEHVVHVLELRQGSRTSRVPSRRHTTRGGRQGTRVALRQGRWDA